MRAVVRTEPGVVELNYMWLPTWIGMNASLKKELEERLAPKIEGMDLTPDSLDEVHGMVVDFLVEKFPIKGLEDYLDALKYVETSEEGQ